MTEQVTVVIANWNRLDCLRSCISAVLSQDYPNFQVIVVDNGSTDGSVAWLQSAHPEVRLICNDTNHGFARATNQGIQVAKGAYIATLNNDAWPEPGWLTALVDAIESDERVGMVASQVRMAQHPELMDSAGIDVDALGIAWNYYVDQPAEQVPNEVKEVFGASGSAALYRKKMLDEIGFFEERYFSYYEDVELAWRAHRAGWRCLYAPQARAEHVRSATNGQGNVFKAYYLARNRVWMFIQHYPLRRFLIWWPLILLVDIASWVWPLVRGHTDALRGHVDALKDWRWAWQKRRQWASYRSDVSLARPRLRAYLTQGRKP